MILLLKDLWLLTTTLRQALACKAGRHLFGPWKYGATVYDSVRICDECGCREHKKNREV